MRRFTIIAGGFLGILAVAAALLFAASERFERPGPLSEDKIVVIPRGSDVETIAGILESQGVIDQQTIFTLGVRISGQARGLKAGEFRLPAHVSMRGAADILEAGRVVARRITVPEGLNVPAILALIKDAEGLQGEIAVQPEEGSLLPETYHYVLGDERSELLQRMATAMDQTLTELWPKRAEDLPFSSVEEAVILASIVEEETAVPQERPLVASVFVNRLRKGMRLQSDPTVIFALTGGAAPLGRPLTRNDLQVDNPFNTYRIRGLPPGPIANPGRESIAAVLNPAESEYFYFVADGTGGHAFAKTLAGHNRNVARWRKIQRQRRQN